MQLIFLFDQKTQKLNLHQSCTKYFGIFLIRSGSPTRSANFNAQVLELTELEPQNRFCVFPDPATTPAPGPRLYTPYQIVFLTKKY